MPHGLRGLRGLTGRSREPHRPGWQRGGVGRPSRQAGRALFINIVSPKLIIQHLNETDAGIMVVCFVRALDAGLVVGLGWGGGGAGAGRA